MLINGALLLAVRRLEFVVRSWYIGYFTGIRGRPQSRNDILKKDVKLLGNAEIDLPITSQLNSEYSVPHKVARPLTINLLRNYS